MRGLSAVHGVGRWWLVRCALVFVFVLLVSACGGGDAGGGFEAPFGTVVEGFPYPIGAAGPDGPPGGEAAVEVGEAELFEAVAVAVGVSGVLTWPNPGVICGLRPQGEVVCWGEYGEHVSGYVGVMGRFTGIRGSGVIGCGLRRSGQVDCWNPFGLTVPDVPFFERFTTIDTSRYGRLCGLPLGGGVECWGGIERELADGVVLPRPDVDFGGGRWFVSVSAGGAHVCALGLDGRVSCWGSNWFGQADAPPGEFVAVDAGTSHTCGLRSDGSVECWGEDSLDAADMASTWFEFGGDEEAVHADSIDRRGSRVEPLSSALLDLEGAVPEAEVRAEMARRAQGWEPPTGQFVQVSAGHGFSCGLRPGGEVECWGYFAREEPRIPLEVYAEVYGPRLWDFSDTTKSQLASGGEGRFDPRFYSLYESLYGARVWELDPRQYLISMPDEGLVESLVGRMRLVDPPPGPFIAVKAGYEVACGIRPTGEVECWGRVDEESATPPGPFATERITGR